MSDSVTPIFVSYSYTKIENTESKEYASSIFACDYFVYRTAESQKNRISS